MKKPIQCIETHHTTSPLNTTNPHMRQKSSLVKPFPFPTISLILSPRYYDQQAPFGVPKRCFSCNFTLNATRWILSENKAINLTSSQNFREGKWASKCLCDIQQADRMKIYLSSQVIVQNSLHNRRAPKPVWTPPNIKYQFCSLERLCIIT